MSAACSALIIVQKEREKVLNLSGSYEWCVQCSNSGTVRKKKRERVKKLIQLYYIYQCCVQWSNSLTERKRKREENLYGWVIWVLHAVLYILYKWINFLVHVGLIIFKATNHKFSVNFLLFIGIWPFKPFSWSTKNSQNNDLWGFLNPDQQNRDRFIQV